MDMALPGVTRPTLPTVETAPEASDEPEPAEAASSSRPTLRTTGLEATIHKSPKAAEGS